MLKEEQKSEIKDQRIKIKELKFKKEESVKLRKDTQDLFNEIESEKINQCRTLLKKVFNKLV